MLYVVAWPAAQPYRYKYAPALGPTRFFTEKYRQCGKNDTGEINTRRSRFRGRFAKQLFVESKNHFFKGNGN